MSEPTSPSTDSLSVDVFESSLLAASLTKFNLLLDRTVRLPVFELYYKNIRECYLVGTKMECDRKWGFYDVMEGPIGRYERCKGEGRGGGEREREMVRLCVEEFDRDIERAVGEFERHAEKYVREHQE